MLCFQIMQLKCQAFMQYGIHGNPNNQQNGIVFLINNFSAIRYDGATPFTPYLREERYGSRLLLISRGNG